MSGSDGILTSRCHEYYGSIPRKRWIITKLDLLCAQEVGYVLRSSSAFAPLSFPSNALPRLGRGRSVCVFLHHGRRHAIL